MGVRWSVDCETIGAAMYAKKWICGRSAAFYIFCIIFPLGSALASPAPRFCGAADLSSLSWCMAHFKDFDGLRLNADISCRSTQDCCVDNSLAILRLDGLSSKIIEGGGHVLRRAHGQKSCPVAQILHSANITVKDLNFDDDENSSPCELSEKKCPSTLQIDSSKNIKFESVHVFFGKGYVVRVWNTDGFVFDHSSISDAGIIGLYVGYYKRAPSKNITIDNSVIAHSRTNAIALQGAIAPESAAPVLVANSVLNNNHWHGLWGVPKIPGGITTGGQLLIADGQNIRVTGNIIANGSCMNCYPAGQVVAPIEIGDQAPPPAGVAGLKLDHNLFLGGSRAAIRQNPATSVTDVEIDNNKMIGFSSLDDVRLPTSRASNLFEREPAAIARKSATDIAGIGKIHFSPSPRPGARPTPIFLCEQDGSAAAYTVSVDRSCGGRGHVVDLLGYPYSPHDPGAISVFGCAKGANGEFFLSRNSSCPGATTTGDLGFAKPDM